MKGLKLVGWKVSDLINNENGKCLVQRLHAWSKKRHRSDVFNNK